MANLLITAALWAVPIALALWALLVLTDSVRRRDRRRALRGIRPGMTVYGADGQPVGVVDGIEDNGALVGGQFIPASAVGRVEAERVVLTRPSIAFMRGTQRGDRTAGGTGRLDSDEADSDYSRTPPQADVRVYQDLGGKRRLDGD
jgi:Uncharacterized protein conserved in bacteria (DUF2171)